MKHEGVHILLDTSAILEFARGSVSVGEMLTEVSDDGGGRIGLPVLCLAAAEYAVRDHEVVVLQLLTRHPAVDLLWPGPDFDAAALIRSVDGQILNGAVAYHATRHNADVLTAQRDRYQDLLPSDQVISTDI